MRIIIATTLLASAVSVAWGQNANTSDGPVIKQQIKVKALAAAGPTGAGTMGFVAGELVGGSPVTGAPYSAQAVTDATQTLADGNRISHSSSSMLYRDSQGRERRELPLPNIGGLGAQSTSTTGAPAAMILISDPVAGVNYTLDSKNHIARKMATPAALQVADTQQSGTFSATLPPPGPGGNVVFTTGSAAGIGVNGAMVSRTIGPQVMMYQDAGKAALPAPNVEQLGTMSIEGVQAEGTRTTVTIPAGQIGNEQPIQIVSERWYSPDLKVMVMSKNSDPRMGETVYRLTNINRLEPLPSMFEVPSDYTVQDAPAIQFQQVQKKL